MLFCGSFSGVILSPFPLLSFIFYLKPSTCTCIVFLLNKLLTKPTSCVETETRWETRDWGGGGGVLLTSFSTGRGLFEGRKLQGSARRKRKFQGRSLRRGSNVYFIQLAEAMRFSPFFLLCPTPTVPPDSYPVACLKKGERAQGIMGPKEDPIILCASSSRPTFPCELRFPTNKRLGTSLLHCLLVATGCQLR